VRRGFFFESAFVSFSSPLGGLSWTVSVLPFVDEIVPFFFVVYDERIGPVLIGGGGSLSRWCGVEAPRRSEGRLESHTKCDRPSVPVL